MLLAELAKPALALEAARGIVNEGRRAQSLGVLAPHLTADLLGRALEAALEIVNEGRRTEALSALMPQLETLPRGVLYPLWVSSLRSSASRTRKNLLTDLRAFIPLISALGDVDALAGVYAAIEESGRWWP
jgi:hypothetical protein